MKRHEYIILAIIIFIIAIIPFVYNIYFATADDPRYVFLMSGSYLGTVCYESIFIGVYLSKLISYLYNMFPSFEWFGIVYYLISLLSYVILGVLCMKEIRRQIVKYSVLFILTSVHGYFILSPQSTMLSTELGFTALLLFWYCKKNYLGYLVALLLFFLGSQFRLKGVFIPFMISSPLFFYGLNLKSALFYKRLICMFGFILIGIACVKSNLSVYKEQQWSNFKRYNDTRGAIADNPNGKKIFNIIDSEVDRIAYDLFYRYRIFDKNILNFEKISKYRAFLLDNRKETVRNNIMPYIKVYYNIGGWCFFLLFFYVTLFLVRKRHYWELCLISAIFLMFLAANLHMMSTSFAKERVLLCPLAVLFWSLFVLSRNKVRYWDYSVVAVSIYLGILFLNRDYAIIKGTIEKDNLVWETEQLLEECDSPKVMITMPADITPEVFHTKDSPIGRKGIIQGWMHIYPKVESKYKSFTIFVQGMPLLVRKDAMEQVDLIQKLLKLYYGIESEVVIKKSTKNYNLIGLEAI